LYTAQLKSYNKKEAVHVLKVDKKLIAVPGKPRSLAFLLQRISIAIQKGNSASILGTHLKSRGLEEIFRLTLEVLMRAGVTFPVGFLYFFRGFSFFGIRKGLPLYFS